MLVEVADSEILGPSHSYVHAMTVLLGGHTIVLRLMQHNPVCGQGLLLQFGKFVINAAIYRQPILLSLSPGIAKLL